MSGKEIILEIGVGANDFSPMPSMLVGYDDVVPPRRFVGGRHYVGLDMPQQESRYYRMLHARLTDPTNLENFEAHRQSPDEIAVMFSGLRQLIARYRPGENTHFIVNDAYHLPFADGVVSEVYMGNVLGSMMYKRPLLKLLQETRRVLQASGMLVARDDMTPNWIPGDIDGLLAVAGFTGEITDYYRGTPEYANLVTKYGTTIQDYEYDPEDAWNVDMFKIVLAHEIVV